MRRCCASMGSGCRTENRSMWNSNGVQRGGTGGFQGRRSSGLALPPARMFIAFGDGSGSGHGPSASPPMLRLLGGDFGCHDGVGW
jgi:hypothetical protein